MITENLMRKITEQILTIFEIHAFGVCEWWGQKLGMRISRIRLSFIYLSFITFGSPLIIYLIMVFVHDQREAYKARQNSVWELE